MSFVITGANSGLGFEVAIQLANLGDEVNKVYITARSEQKADGAIKELVAKTGRPASFFSSFIFDTNDLDACRAAAAACPDDLKGVILNAGGWGSDMVLPSGVIDLFSRNVLGHAVFLEDLLSKGKLGAGARVVYAGSFAARGSDVVPCPTVKDAADSKEWRGYMDGSGFEKFDQSVSYSYTKLIAALYMGKLAREHADVSFFTISPGACTGTNGASQAKGIMRCLIPATLRVMSWFGAAHSVHDGGRRFVQGVTGHDFPFQSGTFVGSAKGTTGPMGDQAKHWDIFANEQAQDAATEALRGFMGAADE